MAESKTSFLLRILSSVSLTIILMESITKPRKVILCCGMRTDVSGWTTSPRSSTEVAKHTPYSKMATILVVFCLPSN